jgi:Fe-S-cluster containining protein
MSVAAYEVDYSDVIGRRAECMEGCGMCCLCQPEVLPMERPFFRESHPDRLVKGREGRFALALKKGVGSCSFLSGRRCGIYGRRPAYCRQFPYHIYVGDRVKVELDLSCRGVWTGRGGDAYEEALAVVAAAEDRIRPAIREAGAVYREFYANCRDAGVMSDPSALRASVAGNLERFADLGYLGRVMDASQEDQAMSLGSLPPERADAEDMGEAARSAAVDSMASDDYVSAPVYCDRGWNWNVFRVDGGSGEIEWSVLGDDGSVEAKARADAGSIQLRPLAEGGSRVLAEYVGTLNGRDSFMGSAFSLMDFNGYEDDMANAYFGCVSATVLDLLWRASMLDHFMGTGMGADGIREAIIFYDMDRLDAPSIGAFI